MAKRGTKPLPEHMKLVAGTGRKDRETVPAVVEVDGVPVKPDWLTGRASEIWDKRVKIYKERGQSMGGCGDALAQYCALGAELVDLWTIRKCPPVALINAYRIFANEFYDTPASQVVRKRDTAPGNKFAAHGKR